MVSAGQRTLPVRRPRARRLLRARAAVGDRVLRHAQDPLRSARRSPAVPSSTSPTARRCSEVAIDTLTGEHRLLAVDILHDVGASLNPAIDLGQIEGGFMQGWGWLAMEELWWNDKGELGTHAPSTYKIPTAHDVPAHFRVDFYGEPNREETIYRSQGGGRAAVHARAVGVSRRCATPSRAWRDGTLAPQLDAPATDERILAAVDDLRARARDACLTRIRRSRSSPRASSATARRARDRRRTRAARRRATRAPRWSWRRDASSAPSAAAISSSRRSASRATRSRTIAAPAPWLVRFPLAARLGQCCGGVATLAFAVVHAGAPWLARRSPVRARRARVARSSPASGGRAAISWSRGRRAGSLGDAALDSRAPCARRTRPRIAGRAARTRARRRDATGDGATLLVHTIVALVRRSHVLVFGNGHVGPRARARARRAAGTRALDRRARGRLSGDVPAAWRSSPPTRPRPSSRDAPRGALRRRSPRTITRSTSTLVTAALARDDWRYLGLIGSASKRNQFEKRLLARGFTARAARAHHVSHRPRGASRSAARSRARSRSRSAAEIVAAHERARDAQRDVAPTLAARIARRDAGVARH